MLTSKTPDTISVNPINVQKLGNWLNLITPVIEVAIMHKPAKDAQVIPTGKDFITFDKEYIHKTIVIALSIDGVIFVKPSALFANVFEAVPKTTAINK